MKRTLLGILAVALAAVLVSNVYAVSVPPPTFCGSLCPGFTPGFWKHNIQVRLGLTNGAYSAFEGGPLDGVKLTNTMMDNFLAAIKAQSGMTTLTFAQALEFLMLQGWNPNRTNMANWFNKVAGYGPY